MCCGVFSVTREASVSKASLKSGPDGRDKHVHTLPVHGAQTRGLSGKFQI